MRGYWLGLVLLGCSSVDADGLFGPGGELPDAGTAGASSQPRSLNRGGVVGQAGSRVTGSGGAHAGTGGAAAGAAATGTGGHSGSGGGVVVASGGAAPETGGAIGTGGHERGAGGALVVGSGGVAAGSGGAMAAGGTSGTGGGPTGSGGAACSLSSPCPATHDCVSGACVLKHSCDCDYLKVRCGTLPLAGYPATACPIRVTCGPPGGKCATGELCAEPTDSTYALRMCLGIDHVRSCTLDAQISQTEFVSAPAGCCTSTLPGCQTPYYACGNMSDFETGAACGGCKESRRSGFSWFCGPG